MLWLKLSQIFAVSCILSSAVAANLPVLLWHGLLVDPRSDFNDFKRLMRDEANVTVKSVDLTVKNMHEREASVRAHPLQQIDQVCNEIKQDAELRNGFNAIGLSQGAQFMRGLIQRCEAAKVRNFISLGGQHQGIYGLPNCSVKDSAMCNLLRKFLTYFAYTDWAQKNVAQATYWHDPLNLRKYQKFSSFLADINNERGDINGDYIRRLQRLDKLVLVKFLRDEMVQPIETQWFGFYKRGSDRIVQNMTETELFREDKLGLRRMMDMGKVKLLQVDDEHLKIKADWFRANIIPLLV